MKQLTYCMVERLFNLVTLINFVKHSYNCKNSGVYIVRVAITCIINGPLTTNHLERSMGMLNVGKESS